MAHKKAGGSSRNGRDSNAQRRGVKRFGWAARSRWQYPCPSARHRDPSRRKRGHGQRLHLVRQDRRHGEVRNLCSQAQDPEARPHSAFRSSRCRIARRKDDFSREGAVRLLPFGVCAVPRKRRVPFPKGSPLRFASPKDGPAPPSPLLFYSTERRFPPPMRLCKAQGDTMNKVFLFALQLGVLAPFWRSMQALLWANSGRASEGALWNIVYCGGRF